jgi:hypothetical protein
VFPILISASVISLAFMLLLTALSYVAVYGRLSRHRRAAMRILRLMLRRRSSTS